MKSEEVVYIYVLGTSVTHWSKVLMYSSLERNLDIYICVYVSVYIFIRISIYLAS